MKPTFQVASFLYVHFCMLDDGIGLVGNEAFTRLGSTLMNLYE
jgi:hypothetical protein